MPKTTTTMPKTTTTMPKTTTTMPKTTTTMPKTTTTHPEETTTHPEETTTMPKTTTTHPEETTTTHVGGGKKVILSKTKKATKVILGSPKLIAPKKHHKTMKHIKMNTTGLKSRLKRAKTIKKRAEDTPLETIKKELIAAKLIKVDTKAPENILRQIYTDFMTMKRRAL